MKLRNHKYTPEDVDCRYCTKFIHGRCRAAICPWIKERIEAGVIGYREAVNESFAEQTPLRDRVKLVMACYDNSFWRDDAHKRRFQIAQAIFGYYRSRNTPAYYAALYLLTSDEELFLRLADCFTRTRIDFRYTCLQGISPELYALYKTAKCLYTQSAEVGVDELADPELFRLSDFRLAVNAMLIVRYGLSAVYMRHGEMDYGCLQS